MEIEQGASSIMASFFEIFSNFLLLGLMVLGGLSYIILIQSANDAPQPVVNNNLLNDSFNDLGESLEGLESTGNTQYDQFNSEIPKPGFGSIVLFGIVSAGKTFSGVTVSVFAIIFKLPLILLGVPQSIAAALFAWLIIGILIALWILYKLGG
jgi:hypothetical protein